jgi:glutathione peroxidase
LVQLHKEKYPDVEIIAFPSLQFGAQEFDNHAEIKKFAETNFAFHKDGFNMMSLSDVNGDNTNEVYQWLKSKTNDKPIQWNFSTVFLVDPNGKVAERHEIRKTKGGPMELLDAISALKPGSKM